MGYEVSYDFRDYLDEELREEALLAEVEEFRKYKDKEAFIAYMEKERKRWGKDPSEIEFVEAPGAPGGGYYRYKNSKKNGNGSLAQPVSTTNKISGEDVVRWFAKFTEHRDKNASTDELTLEELIEDSRETYSQIPMFDFGLGEMSNHQAIMDYYGYDLYRQIKKEIEESYDAPHDRREQGHITTELWKRLKDIRSGRTPRPKKSSKKKTQNISVSDASNNKSAKPIKKVKEQIKVHQRERQPGDDYFLTTERGLIKNESYLELFKGPDTVFQVIWANLVRKDWHDSKEYPIREKYYDQRKLLAYCTTYRHLAQQCKMSHNTVRRIIDDFKEAGVVRTEPFKPKNKKQGQTVFILGKWSGSGNGYEEQLFRDEIFLSPKLVKK